MRTPITIKELADMLGMSHSTVSRALNDHPAISQETRRRVSRMAVKYGYVPNSAARVLRNEPSGIVGLVMPDIRNEFYTTVAKTIAEAAARKMRQLILATTDDQPSRECFAVHSLYKVRAEGVIITPTMRPEKETLSLIARMRTVQLIRVHPAIDSPAVVIADRSGISMAVAHLLELGHRKIGYIGPAADLSTGYDRLRGFHDGFSGSDCNPTEDWICTGPPRPHFGATALEKLMKSANDRPSGVVLGSPEMALGVFSAAREKAIDIPGELSVVGYGDLSWSSLVGGGLTTVSLPDQEVADRSAKLLLDGLDAEMRGVGAGQAPEMAHVHDSFAPHLNIRGSTRRHR